MVEEIDSYYEVLQCLKGQIVNVDELDFLAKLLDGFDTYEAQEFQAACFAYGCHDIKDLINMTYCCRETTIISDFSKLEEAGKNHYITTQGEAVLGGGLDAVDGKALAKQLVQSGNGDPSALLCVTRLLHHMSRIFRQTPLPANPQGVRIDSKHRKALLAKRLAMGHKVDDHENAGMQQTQS